MIRGMGLNRDDGTIPRKFFRDLRRRLGSEPRGSADLSAHAPPVWDQDGVGSCVGHGLGGGIYTTLSARKTPLGFYPSPKSIYQISLATDRASEYPFTEPRRLPALRDVGTMILSGVKSVSEWGVVECGKAVVVDGTLYNTDCPPLEKWLPSREPDLVMLEKASRKLIVGAHEIPPNESSSLAAALALDEGFAVVLGGYVDSTFESYNEYSEPLGPQDSNDPNGGGHCTFLIGYKTENGKRIFRLQNSWGPWWGDNGLAWVTEAFVEQMWEAYIMTVEVA